MAEGFARKLSASPSACISGMGVFPISNFSVVGYLQHAPGGATLLWTLCNVGCLVPFVHVEIELKTAPADFRFPTTNQTRHCFTRYIEYHKCLATKGDGSSECENFAKYYRSLCPGEWVEKWNEQRSNGTFPGPL